LAELSPLVEENFSQFTITYPTKTVKIVLPEKYETLSSGKFCKYRTDLFFTDFTLVSFVE